MKVNKLFYRKHYFEEAKNKLLEDNFIPTGICELDNLITGMHKGSFCIIASRPDMGNTSALCSLAFYSGLKFNKALFLSLQHSSDELTDRFIHLSVAYNLRIDKYAKYTLPKFKIGKTLRIIDLEIEDHMDALFESDLANCNLLIVDAPQSIDYEYFQIIACQHNLPVICSYSLGSTVETKAIDLRPSLIDLPNKLENLADLVIFLNRPEYYGITEFENGNTTKNQMELIVSKNNFGKRGSALVNYYREVGIIQHNISRTRPT